jgi:hypothetical protein
MGLTNEICLFNDCREETTPLFYLPCIPSLVKVKVRNKKNINIYNTKCIQNKNIFRAVLMQCIFIKYVV